MLREQIKQNIDKQISIILNTEIKTEETDYIDFRGAGLNSVHLLTLIIKLEELFGFEFDDELFVLNGFEYISDIINLVEKTMENQ